MSPVKSTVNDGTVSSLTSAVGGAASEMRGRRRTGRIVERRMFATLWRPIENFRLGRDTRMQERMTCKSIAVVVQALYRRWSAMPRERNKGLNERKAVCVEGRCGSVHPLINISSICTEAYLVVGIGRKRGQRTTLHRCHGIRPEKGNVARAFDSENFLIRSQKRILR